MWFRDAQKLPRSNRRTARERYFKTPDVCDAVAERVAWPSRLEHFVDAFDSSLDNAGHLTFAPPAESPAILG